MKFSGQLRRALSGLLLSAVPALVHAQLGAMACGSLDNHYGPFDYRRSSAANLELVEGTHFTPAVENLIKGNTSLGPGGDLTYTLNVFPNHHRALMSMMKLALREKRSRPTESQRTMECWFDRGERYAPDDAMVKIIHGLYLTKTGKPAEARDKLDEARALGLMDANAYYNLGLGYFDLQQYDKALESAHAAYAQGFPLPGLRDKLRRAGKWKDPAPEAHSGVN